MKDIIEPELLQILEPSLQAGKRKAYEEYKDSGVEWLEEIPAHWSLNRLKFSCTTNPSKLEIHHLPKDTKVSFLPMELIGEDGQLTLTEEKEIQQVSQGFTYFYTGDVIVAKITPCFENGKGALCKNLTNNIGFGTTELHVLRPGRFLYAPFLHYVTKSRFFRLLGVAYMTGSAGQQRVPEEFIKNLLIGLPSLPEQYDIVTFLNQETVRINELIARKKHMITLLQERRTAIINQAVTRGLNLDVPMKDSGIDWLGDIPKHWEVRRLKHSINSIKQGWSPACENRLADDDEWGVLKVGCVNGNEFNDKEHKALPKEIKPIPELEIKTGDVLMSRANTRELLGSASIVREVRAKLLLCDKLYRLNLDQKILLPEFFTLAMKSSIVRFQLERDATGASSSMQNIAQFAIVNVTLPIPNIQEQKEILLYLDQETAKIDKLISVIQEGIKKLQEYSTALISAAVTGKIDVRGEVTTVQAEETAM